MTAFKLKITRKVTGCGPQLTADISLSVEPSLAVDQVYSLHSDGWWNKGTIQVTYAPSGVSTALNATSEGQGGVIASNVVTTITAITPLLGLVSDGPGSGNACTRPVADAIQLINGDGEADAGLASVVRRQTTELAALTDELTRTAALGPVTSTEDRRALQALIIRTNVKKDELAASQRRLNEQLRIVTHVQEVEWPSVGSERQGTFSLSREAFQRWSADRRPEAIARFDVFVSLADVSPPAGGLSDVPPQPPNAIPVRFAAPGLLQACHVSVCGSPDAEQIFSGQYPVLQLGPVFYLQAPSGAFRSASVEIALDPAGNPTTIGTRDTAATFETITSASARSAPAIAGVPAAISAAELARVQARTNQQLAENALAAARAQGATVAQLAPLQAETALANAEAAQITADSALALARQAQSTP
ncbi:hypothetical protein [Brevundimonas sp.]|uniref:hypothetical protein n=1 Tax=Brevundimonas sp. TaxID=1871086 RepID=UPI001DB49009|nr:hypothetical protein [Brevundimonas sp.]MBA4000071.1 hypothetical protein [Brevundimonas sp.]